MKRLYIALILFSLAIFNCKVFDFTALENGTTTTTATTVKQLKVFVSSATINFISTTPNNITPASPAIVNTTCNAVAGIAIGNCICNSLASSAGFQAAGAQKFHAWMSDIAGTDAACNVLGGSGRLPAATV